MRLEDLKINLNKYRALWMLVINNLGREKVILLNLKSLVEAYKKWLLVEVGCSDQSPSCH